MRQNIVNRNFRELSVRFWNDSYNRCKRLALLGIPRDRPIIGRFPVPLRPLGPGPP